MQAVKYARASSVDEAVTLLRDGGETARVLAGGTDVIVQARERRRHIELFVDIKHIPELTSLTHEGDGGLTVGAATPLYHIYGDAEVVRRFPALAESVHVIGGKAIQGRASLGGNLANASPAADSIPAMIVLAGVARVAGPGGPREVPVVEFCSGPGRNVLQPGEFITSIHFPPPSAASGQAWERFIPRNEMDIAVVNAATYLAFDGDVVTEARFALGAVAATPLSVPAAAEAVVGRRLTDETIAAAAEAARQTATPISDMRGTIRQRKHLVGVLTEHVIRRAVERARA
ncbi:MAG: xanthine dehydrogenase family protein subunit M [Dehalococcoidia bacterium]|nr:xanthine dehydrogenase family protein subunit M [Dehalococcoidia bacterium]